jgi:hypothetical protein
MLLDRFTSVVEVLLWVVVLDTLKKYGAENTPVPEMLTKKMKFTACPKEKFLAKAV